MNILKENKQLIFGIILAIIFILYLLNIYVKWYIRSELGQVKQSLQHSINELMEINISPLDTPSSMGSSMVGSDNISSDNTTVITPPSPPAKSQSSDKIFMPNKSKPSKPVKSNKSQKSIKLKSPSDDSDVDSYCDPVKSNQTD
jgi:hypothetical protein